MERTSHCHYSNQKDSNDTSFIKEKGKVGEENKNNSVNVQN